MKPPLPEPMSQRLFALTLILLTALGFFVLWQDLHQRPVGRSRIDWSALVPAKP